MKNNIFASNFKKVFCVGLAAAFIVSGFFALNANATITTINLSSPVGNEILRGTVNITWTSNGESTDTIEVSYSTNDFYNDTRVVIDSVPNTGIYAWNTTTIPDGNSYKIQVKNVANSANSRSLHTFTIDNTPPTTPTILTPNGGQILKGGDTYNITWTPTTDVNPSTTPITIEYASDGSTFVPIATNEADDGSYTWTIPSDNTTAAKIRVISIDLASNTSSDVSDAAFTIDSIAPTIPVANIVGTTIPAANDTIIITFTEPVVVAGGWANVFTSITGSVTSSLTLTHADFNYSGNALTITLDEATDYMYLRNGEIITVDPVADAIKDAAGNSLSDAPVVGTSLVTGDVAAPTVVLTYNPDRPVRDADTVTVTATFNETLRGVPNIAIDTAGIDVSATPMTSTANPLVWTYVWDVPAGSDGTATVTITASDLAGNANATATNNTRTIDNTLPGFLNYTLKGLAQSVAFHPGLSPDVAIVVTASEPVNWGQAKIYKSNNSAIYKELMSPSGDGTVTGTFVPWDGSLTAGGPGPVDGVYNIRVHITDLAGNDVPVLELTPFTITVDTVNPTLPAFTAPAANTVYKTNTPLQFTPDDSATTVTCAYKVDSGSYVAVPCTAATPVSTTIPDGSLSDGRHTVTIKVTDAANNILESSPVSFVFDNNNTLTVDDTPATNPDFSTISEAVTKSTANDTISVAAGSYTENVTVNKSLTLQGASSATVTVNAASSASIVFNISANNVNISGFTISGATGGGQAGIYIGNSVTGSNIHNNILTGNYDGIWLGSGSNYNTLENNTLSGNYQGFEVYISNYNTFTDNIVSSNNNYGFKIDSGDHNTFMHNTANSNTKYGFYVVIGDGGGATNSTFTNNIANSNTQYGIRINGGSGNTLTGNTFDSNILAGIRLKEGITTLAMDHNNITNSPIGIDINASVIDVTSWAVTHNNISGNSSYGVSNNGTGILNAESNWWGAVSGPYHSPENTAGASNAAVSDNIDYSPWCLTSACTAPFGSSDPLDHFNIVPSAASAIVNVPITLTVTAKDAANISRVNDTSVVSMAADHGASLGTLLLTLASGVGNTTVTNSVIGIVNVSGIKVGDTITGATSVEFVGSDLIAPTVLLPQFPADGSLDVAINVSPTITFSEAMDANSVNGSTVKLRLYSDDSVISSTISLNDARTVATIDPISNLLNSTDYYIWVSGATDVAGNTITAYTTKANQEFMTGAESVTLAVTGVSATQSLATADDNWDHGWHWTFYVTVPTVESSLSIQFSDWTGSAGVILVANNTRFYSAQSDHADAAHAITITTANTYTGPILLTGDLDPATPGRQIQITVETKVPVGSAGGSYSASYGIRTTTP